MICDFSVLLKLPWVAGKSITIMKQAMVDETQVQFLGWGDPLEEEMATHSSILAWEIPWTEEPEGYSP